MEHNKQHITPLRTKLQDAGRYIERNSSGKGKSQLAGKSSAAAQDRYQRASIVTAGEADRFPFDDIEYRNSQCAPVRIHQSVWATLEILIRTLLASFT